VQVLPHADLLARLQAGAAVGPGPRPTAHLARQLTPTTAGRGDVPRVRQTLQGPGAPEEDPVSRSGSSPSTAGFVHRSPGWTSRCSRAAARAERHGRPGRLINLFSGAPCRSWAIFALGIMPYITSSIFMQLLTVVIPRLERWQKEGEAARSGSPSSRGT
jgi:hypothetical protein